VLKEERRELGLGDVLRYFGGGGLAVAVLVLGEDRDGELKELGGFGGESDGWGGLDCPLGGDYKRAALAMSVWAMTAKYLLQFSPS
jgi:hypothetical protein